MNIKNTLLVMLITAFSLPFGSARAYEWVRDAEVIWVGTYATSPDHFVEFSAVPQVCRVASPSNPKMKFSEASTGGKTMLAMVMTAIVSKRKVDYDALGCDIRELYLK